MMAQTTPGRAGFVYSFYSYKGGTGRSMTMANVAVLMAGRGFKVLAVDWDLEAPGLEKYFENLSPGLVERRKQTEGIIELLERWVAAHTRWLPSYEEWRVDDEARGEARSRLDTLQHELARATATRLDQRLEALRQERDAAEVELRQIDEGMAKKYPSGTPKPDAPDWRTRVIPLSQYASGGRLDFMSAGRGEDTYPSRVNALRWDALFDEHDLGLYLEQLRDEWRTAYDFVLVDSRTGISDIEGICTVLLPDCLVLVFTTMEQSVQGVLDVWKHAAAERARLPVARGRLLALPLPSRDEIDRENLLASQWHRTFAERFDTVYRQWLPENVRPLDAVKQLALPYVARWSFGERLPVAENAMDLASPRSINAAYDRIALLLVHRLSWGSAALASGDVLHTIPTALPSSSSPQDGPPSEVKPPPGLLRMTTATAVAAAVIVAGLFAVYGELVSRHSTNAIDVAQAQAAAKSANDLLEAEKKRSADLDEQLQAAKAAPALSSLQAQEEALKAANARYFEANAKYSEANAKYSEATTKLSDCVTKAGIEARQAANNVADLKSQLAQANHRCPPKKNQVE
jgi:CobQ/CobB/MinD/ParA nucleotide binding domain